MSINIDKPPYDQNTYFGRVKHFMRVTNPLNCLASNAALEEAKRVVTQARSSGRIPSGYDERTIWKAKYLYDSAFHPDTGAKMIIFGRMSAQVPMNTLVVGSMITFYKTTAQTVFWQWFNQTFNAVVNYTNRSGKTEMGIGHLATSYVLATGGALGTALYLNSLTKKMAPMWGRLVPFAAVSASNMINIPMMRSQEIISGVPVSAPDGYVVGNSRRAAVLGISLVLFSRILMSVPGMTLTPWATNYAAQKGLFKKYPNGLLPFQCTLVMLCLTFATPFGCAIFKQQASIRVSFLEGDLRDYIKKSYGSSAPQYVQFNKGL